MQPRTPKSPTRPDYSFRCPSCLGVLSVSRKQAGTSAPCPLCRSPIIAPQPNPNGIPFAHLEGPESSTPDPAGKEEPLAERRKGGRVILADGGISQIGSSGSKGSSSGSQIIIFVVLAVLFLLVGIWLIAGQ